MKKIAHVDQPEDFIEADLPENHVPATEEEIDEFIRKLTASDADKLVKAIFDAAPRQ